MINKRNYVPGEFETLPETSAGTITNDWQYFVLDGFFKFEVADPAVYADGVLLSPTQYELSVDENYTEREATKTGKTLIAMIKVTDVALLGQTLSVAGLNFGTMVDNEAMKAYVDDSQGVGTLPSLVKSTKDFTGFVCTEFLPQDLVTMDFDLLSSTFTIEPNASNVTKYTYISDDGTEVEVDGPRSIQCPFATSRVWFIFWDGSTGQLKTFNSVPNAEFVIRDNVFVAEVIWRRDGSDLLKGGFEAHSLLPWLEHLRAHKLDGTRCETGLLPAPEDGTTNLVVPTGIVVDEDIWWTTLAKSAGINLQATFRIDDTWDGEDHLSGVLLDGGSTPLWNRDLGGGNFDTQPLSNNKYMCQHITASPDFYNREVMIVTGQAQYDTQQEAYRGALSEIDKLVIEGLPFPEFKIVATAMIQKTGGGWEWVPVDADGNMVRDWRFSKIGNPAGQTSQDQNLGQVLSEGNQAFDQIKDLVAGSDPLDAVNKTQLDAVDAKADQNASDIITNQGAIALNASNISSNTSSIGANSIAIAQNASDIDDLEAIWVSTATELETALESTTGPTLIMIAEPLVIGNGFTVDMTRSFYLMGNSIIFNSATFNGGTYLRLLCEVQINAGSTIGGTLSQIYFRELRVAQGSVTFTTNVARYEYFDDAGGTGSVVGISQDYWDNTNKTTGGGTSYPSDGDEDFVQSSDGALGFKNSQLKATISGGVLTLQYEDQFGTVRPINLSSSGALVATINNDDSGTTDSFQVKSGGASPVEVLSVVSSGKGSLPQSSISTQTSPKDIATLEVGDNRWGGGGGLSNVFVSTMDVVGIMQGVNTADTCYQCKFVMPFDATISAMDFFLTSGGTDTVYMGIYDGATGSLLRECSVTGTFSSGLYHSVALPSSLAMEGGKEYWLGIKNANGSIQFGAKTLFTSATIARSIYDASAGMPALGSATNLAVFIGISN